MATLLRNNPDNAHNLMQAIEGANIAASNVNINIEELLNHSIKRQIKLWMVSDSKEVERQKKEISELARLYL